MSWVEVLLLFEDESGGISSGAIEPPATTEYLLTPDGNVLITPDGAPAEDI